jgi:hypothetical protein
MTPHWRTLTLPVLGTLLFGCGSLLASDEELDRQTLTGLKGFSVLIESISPEANRDGLTTDQLQTDVELRLRKSGVNVLPSGSGNATLYVYAHLLKLKSISGYVYTCEVTVHQGVIVVANNTVSWQDTWSVADLGIVRPENMSKVIRGTTGDLVDKFLNAYLSVNPKQ